MFLYVSIVSTAPQDSNVVSTPIFETVPTNNKTSRYESFPITISSFNNLAKNSSNIEYEPTNENFSSNNKNEEKLEIFNINSNTSLENNEFIRHVETDDVITDFTEIDQSGITTDHDIATEDDFTTTLTPKTTPTLRLFPKFLPKLSNLKKSKKNDVPANSLKPYVAKDKSFKRKFKSRCRCEKIQNCPKLQITVPRCPDEYFLCCF